MEATCPNGKSRWTDQHHHCYLWHLHHHHYNHRYHMIQTITNTVMPIANITFYYLVVLTSQKYLIFRPYVFFVFCKLFQSRQVSQFLAGSVVKKHDCEIPMCAKSVSRVCLSLVANRNIEQRPLVQHKMFCVCVSFQENRTVRRPMCVFCVHLCLVPKMRLVV